MMSRKTNTLEDAFEVFENAANGDLLSKDLGAA